MIHYKTDLLTDEALATYSIKVGDVLTLRIPGTDTESKERVESIEQTDAGNDPNTGVHLNRVTLLLNSE